MSLLIKALANAAKDKQAQPAASLASTLELTALDTRPAVANAAVSAAGVSKQPELSLAKQSGFNAASLSNSSKRQVNEQRFMANIEIPFRASGTNTAESVPLNTAVEPNAAHPPRASATDQAAAAKAFVKYPPAATSKPAFIGFALAGGLFLALAVHGYVYMRDLNSSDRVQLTPMSALAAPAATAADALVAMPEITHTAVPATAALTATADDGPRNHAVAERDETETETATKLGITAQVGTERPSLKASNEAAAGLATASSVDLTRPHGLVQLRSKKPLPAVDPAVLAAYEAFNRGEDAAAQQQYRQLLQHDVRNVDALFGMAAIAQRQGRDADAVGWYQALLAIEPRNMGAQSALLNLQPGGDDVASGSRIKSMLVQQPESASLHAALGNLYAAQNQWTDAQQAYFNASQFAPDNADYAFNLAISLDQLGKSKLALQQYQRSLDLLNSFAASSPDRGQLEARIQALQ